MTDERLHRTSSELGGVVSRWARAVLGVGTNPPLRRPRAPRIDPIRRSWVGAFWRARIGVRAGMTLDDFLRARLASYVASLPVSGTRLPLTVEVDGGQILVREAQAPPPARPTGETEPWLAPLVAVEGPAIRQEVAQIEVRLAMLEGEIESARRRTAEISRKLAADIAAGIVAGPPEVNATAEQLGRPPVRSAAPRVLAFGFAGAALAAETWQIAQPLLRSGGIDPTDIAAGALRQPGEVAFVSIFALGIAAGMFALAHAGLNAAAALFQADVDGRRRRLLVSAALGAWTVAALIGAAVTAFPAPADGRLQAAALVLLVSVPFAAALAVRAARRDAEQRATELTAALAWDRERARALGERGRRLEELAWAEEEEHALERQRLAAHRRLKDVNARAVEAARIAADAERRERAALSRLAHSLVGALELDRYEFIRQASARGALDLVAPRRRSAPEARPAFDEATAPVAAPVARVEGRLAS